MASEMKRENNRGDYVKVYGLKSRDDLNGKEGYVLKPIGKRYEVKIIGLDDSTFSLLPKRLEYLGQSCVVIGPCDKGISSDEIPIQTSYLKGPSEYEEIQELKKRFGWWRPVGMAWCSENAKYKDLYVYYDSECRETVNNLADVVFPAMSADKCCPTVSVKMPGRESGIRGSVVVIRQEPPRFTDYFMSGGVQQSVSGQRDFEFDRLITHDEIRNLYNNAIQHKGEHSHYEKVKQAQERGKENKPNRPVDSKLDDLSKMFSSKFGMGVQFHDPNDITSEMYKYMQGR